MTTVNPHAYAVTVRQKAIDDELLFEATVAEVPDVRGYGDTYGEAYESAIDAIASLAEDALAEGAEFPKPRTDDSEGFTGRVTLRLPRTLHRLASETAAAQGVSFNSYLASVIATDVA